ncbi:MAG: response regulator [Vicinamibacterales bacterium]
MRVLIVDDEPTLRRMVRLTLEDLHEVHEAGDAAQALEAVRAHGPFDVVLLDQKMPGMSGVELLGELRRVSPSTRVVMLTAHASLDLATAALAGGASHFLAKPMTPALLRAAVIAARPPSPDATPAAAGRQEHTITLNGFAIDATSRARVEKDGSATHVFAVSHVVGGWTKEAEVHIARDAFRASGRPDVAVAGRLAGLVARRALADRLWREGMLPDAAGLRLTGIGAEDLAAALRADPV